MHPLSTPHQSSPEDISREELLATARKKLKNFQKRRSMSLSLPHGTNFPSGSSTPLSPLNMPPPGFKPPSKSALLARRRSVGSATFSASHPTIALSPRSRRSSRWSVSSASGESLHVVQEEEIVESPMEYRPTQTLLNVQPRPSQSTPFPSMSLSTPPTSSPLRPETQLLPTTATTPTPPLPAEPQSTTTHRHSLPPIPTQTRSLTLTDLRSRFPAATSAATSKTYSPLPNLQESLIWVAQNARLLAEREGMREEAERVKKELEVAMSGRKEAEEEMGRLTARLKEREAECEDLKRQMEEARALVERIEGDKVTIEREIDDLRARIVEEEARREAAAAGYRADQESWARMNADLHEQLVVMTGKRDRTLRELERIKGTAGMEAERVAEVKGRNTSDEVERLNAEGGEDADADVDTASRAKHTARLSTDPHHPSLPLRASSNRRHSEPIQWPSHVRLHRLLSHNHDPQYHQHASLFPFTLPTFSVSNPNRTSTDTATSPASLDTVLVRRALAEREAAVAEAEKAREERDAWREAAKGLEKRVVEVDMVRELRRRVGEAEVDPWGVVGQEGLMDEAGGFEGVTDELIS